MWRFADTVTFGKRGAIFHHVLYECAEAATDMVILRRVMKDEADQFSPVPDLVAQVRDACGVHTSAF